MIVSMGMRLEGIEAPVGGERNPYMVSWGHLRRRIRLEGLGVNGRLKPNGS
jgi:hypothetical protein